MGIFSILLVKAFPPLVSEDLAWRKKYVFLLKRS